MRAQNKDRHNTHLQVNGTRKCRQRKRTAYTKTRDKPLGPYTVKCARTKIELADVVGMQRRLHILYSPYCGQVFAIMAFSLSANIKRASKSYEVD